MTQQHASGGKAREKGCEQLTFGFGFKVARVFELNKAHAGRVVKQNQSWTGITFDIQLKTAVLVYSNSNQGYPTRKF